MISDAGASQCNYAVPVTIQAKMNDGSTQIFAGCYFLHLTLPAAQDAPFTPLGFVNARIQAVSASASADDLMRENCRFIH